MQQLPFPGRSPDTGTDRIVFWRPVPRTRCDVVCAHVAVRALPVHVHEEFELTIARDAHLVLDGGGKPSLVTPGALVLINPREIHGAVARDGVRWEATTLLVSPDLMREVSQRDARFTAGSAPHFPRRVVSDPQLSARFEALLQQLAANDGAPGLEDALVSALGSLVAWHALPTATANRERMRGVRRAHAHLQEHVVEDVQLDELAIVTGLSKYHLLRAFKREFGLSPHEFHMQLRLARARSLIGAGEPLSRVPYDAGFADQSHLVRRFKDFVGLTPSAFARQVAGNAPGPTRSRDVQRSRVRNAEQLPGPIAS